MLHMETMTQMANQAEIPSPANFPTKNKQFIHKYLKPVTTNNNKNFYIFMVLAQLFTQVIFPVKAQSSEDPESIKTNAKNHLDQGNALLAAGQLTDALIHYNKAVEQSPDNYQSRYRRATCLLALGRAKSALPDLNKTILLQPSFWQAKNQRGQVYLKQGKFDEALTDFESIKHYSDEVRKTIIKVRTTRQHFDNAKIYMKRGHYDHALKSLDKIKEICPWSAELRTMSADCYEAYGKIEDTINNLKPLIQISPSTAPETYLRLASLYYKKAEIDQSLDQIRECLRIDPDHKKCFAFYKVVKKLNKQFDMAKKIAVEERYDDAIAKMAQVLATTENVSDLMSEPSAALMSLFNFQKCKIYEKKGDFKSGIDACEHATEGIDEYESIPIILKRAKLYEDLEDWDSAIKDYNRIRNIDRHYSGIDEKLEKAQKMKKRAKSRDYYKILGVSRRAKTKEIKSAYKKLAMKYHPDRCGKGETEGWTDEKCTQEFRNIADAKEVLTDKEKRSMFDNGTDPLDAEEQAEQNRHGHHGFNPFGHGGPFGNRGGGGGFKFHFGGF